MIEATHQFQATPPDGVEIHHNGTVFMRDVCGTEEEVLDDISRYMKGMPAYNPDFFQVAEPALLNCHQLLKVRM